MRQRWIAAFCARSVTSKRARLASIAVLVLALLLVGGGAAFAMYPSSEPTYTGCLNERTGTVTHIARGDRPLGPCTYGLTIIHLSGGDLTSLTAGTGLTGGGDSGDVGLSIASSYQLPQACGAGQLPAWTGSAWKCIDNITSVTAGTGLAGGGDSGDINLSVSPSYQLPQTCAAGQLPAWTGSVWKCVNDANSTYQAGTGLDLSGTTFSVEPTYRMPQGCNSGQVAKWNGSAWTCQADAGLLSLTTLSSTVSEDHGIPDDGTLRPYASISVPSAGTYLVITTGTIKSEMNVDDFRDVRCTAAGDNMTLSSLKLNDDAGIQTPFSLIGTSTVAAGDTISLFCRASEGADGIAIGDTRIVVVKVSN
ncbi:MAG: hypothetical protein M9890_14690 [Thermomicrobiales bacterium]|nr:hypothetical protein [Thermomicrobiales bacterium]